MPEAVLDASVVLKWFHQSGEARTTEARLVRADFEAGKLAVFAPPLLFLEIVNVAGRRWLWSAEPLAELATQLDQVGFELQEPDLLPLTRWAARGLTAYDASYVALAETLGVPLITDDALIHETAPDLTIPLAEIQGPDDHPEDRP